jgi:uncharacterized membrane protein (UPF0127 family)
VFGETVYVRPRRIVLLTADGLVVSHDCRLAGSFFARLRGLMGAAELPRGDGVLFPGTRSVHTHFMRFPIDVVFLDADDRVVRIAPELPPWRGASAPDASAVLELAAGECKRHGVRTGMMLRRREPAAA